MNEINLLMNTNHLWFGSVSEHNYLKIIDFIIVWLPNYIIDIIDVYCFCSHGDDHKKELNGIYRAFIKRLWKLLLVRQSLEEFTALSFIIRSKDFFVHLSIKFNPN